MKYKIRFKNNKVYRFESKEDLVDKLIPTLKKYENKPDLNQKQKNIIKYAIKGDRIELICGNYSAKDIVDILGGQIL